MKEKIHPKYGSVLVSCASCGSTFVTASTRLDGAKKEYQGRQYPAMTLEICSQCHPFFSGKQIYVDTAGRVEKFSKRYATFTGKPPDKLPKPAKVKEAPKELQRKSLAPMAAQPQQAGPQRSRDQRQGREQRPPRAGGDRGRSKERPPKAEAAPAKP